MYNIGGRRRTFVSVSEVETDLIEDDFDDCVERFIEHLRMKNRSEYTVDYYRRELRKFMRTLESMRLNTRLNRITGEIIASEYIRYMREAKGVRHATIAATMRALRAFFNWALSQRIIKENPMREIEIGNVKHRTVETFTRQQIRDILDQPDRQLFVGLRDYTIMVTLLETGVRVRELCDIKVNDVRFADSQILIRGKNGDDRLVPIQAQASRVLKAYVKARGYSPSDYLFLSVDDKQMNRDGVGSRIKKYGRMANITNVRCSPHTFRHTFAKMSVKNGADLFTLQEILGHKTLDMVKIYVKLFSNDIKEAHARFSPIENLYIRN